MCRNVLRVPEAEIEARVFGALRDQILVPAVVAAVVARAAEIVRQRQAQGRGATAQARHDEIGREIAKLLEIAGRVEGLEEIAVRLGRLKAERDRLAAELRAAVLPYDPAGLRAGLEIHLAALREDLLQGPDQKRRALRALLRDERLRVGPDPDRGFRVEGTAWLTVPQKSLRPVPWESRALGQDGSGGGI